MRHIETIENHPINASIENLQELLNTANNLEEKTLEETEGLARVSQIFTAFKTSFSKTEKNLISTTWLTECGNGMESIIQMLNSFITQRNVTYITSSITGYLDILLTGIVRFNSIMGKQTLKESGDGYIATIQSYIKDLKAEIENLNKEIEGAKIENKENFAEVSDSIKKIDTTIANEQTKLTNLALTQQKDIEQNRLSFSSLVETAKKEFSDFQIKFKTENNDVIKEYTKIFDGYELEVKKIVGKVNTNMFSHKYKQVANESRLRSIIWHVIAVLLMGLVGFASYFLLLKPTGEELNWTSLVARIFSITSMVTGATYAARQASKQEKVERYARQVEMEMVSLEPFIESLEETDKTKVKQELVQKYFGNLNAMELSKNEMDSKAEDLILNEKTMPLFGKLFSEVTKNI